MIAIDRDPDAIVEGAPLAALFGGRLMLVNARYSDMDAIAAALGLEAVDGVALDLGVSSMQLDRSERGFSFMKDAPLDMRMGKDGPTAADIVNTLSEKELAGIIGRLGEERRARAIAKAIVKRRAEKPIETTGELAEIVARVVGRKSDETKHPATRTFQALRLYLNEELEELAKGLAAAWLLKAGGQLVVVTFHSLEDRIAKRFFASRSAPAQRLATFPEQGRAAPAPSFRLLNRRPLEPNQREIAENPRARSARLAAAERTEAPSHPLDLAALGVP